MQKTKTVVLRNYESLIMFDPKLETTRLEDAIKDIERIIKECTKSEITVETLGKRTLSFPVKKASEATYALYHFSGDPGSISKIKEEIKHNENILRTIFIRKES